MNNKSKSTFSLIFLFLVVVLMILPFLTTFNELLTVIFFKTGLYRLIEGLILPFETRMVVVILQVLGQKAVASASMVSIWREGSWQKILISWNCIGWQSSLILVATLLTGLQGNYTRVSKIECLTMGILGTFLVNILRISLIALMVVYVNVIPATVAHDYLSTFILILWLFFFWWFSYSFVLEEKSPSKN